MEKLVIKLKQHTPLIHFQHDQEGATLRASEVKPKLDRFILSKMGDGNYEAGTKIAKEKGWLVGKGDHPSLNYKMRIVSSGKKDEFMLASYIKADFIRQLNNRQITAIINTPFFAQEKQNGEIVRNRLDWNKIDKKGIIEKDEISVNIWLMNNQLAVVLAKQIQSFFVSNNFGTRQSKGFGSFLPTAIQLNDETLSLNNNENILKEQFAFVYKKEVSDNKITTILSTINDDYKLIKSGRTRPNYAKSKLLLYSESLDNNTGWDKKYIKVNTNDSFPTEENDYYILKCAEKNRRSCYSKKSSYKYFRALLGLAEQYEFLLENPPLGNFNNKMIIKVKNKNIERYQSPLLFKVINRTIYIVGNEVSKEMLGKPFQFLANFQNDNGYKDEPVVENGEPIYTPSSFSLRDFIRFAMNDNTNNARLGYETIKQ